MDNFSEELRLANRESGPIAVRLLDEDLLYTLKKIILNHWQTGKNYSTQEVSQQKKDISKEFFPAPQPVSLGRRDLSKLIENDYLVCAKSDGMRFLLMCYGGSCYMVDRAFKFYKVKLMFKNDALYNLENNQEPGLNDLGGIFDGELVLNKKEKWQYVMHDCINIYGKDISKNYFPVRHAEIIKVTCDYWIPDGSEFRITSKQFFPFKQLGLLNRLIIEDKLDHKTDGIICTPKNKRVGARTQNDLFKWKPRHLHTFDFKIIKGPYTYTQIDPVTLETTTINLDGITAFVNKDSSIVPYVNAPRGSLEEKVFLENLEKNCPEFVNGGIVECDLSGECDSEEENYIPIKLRSDKTHPNSSFTVIKTLGNIKENITIEELIDLANPE